MTRRIFSRREAMWQEKLSCVACLPGNPGAVLWKNAVVLPVRRKEGYNVRNNRYPDGLYEGGVATKRYRFVAGCLRNSQRPEHNYACCSAYRPRTPVIHRPESVVFGGVLYGHYGHLLVDGLSRMWWHAMNQDDARKLVFVSMPGADLALAKDLFACAGIHEYAYEIIEEPTQFAEVLVPEQALYPLEGVVYEDWLRFLDLVAQRCVERSTIDAAHNVYLTRTRLVGNDGVGEQYFEDYFARQGFSVVAPESLLLRDQIALYAQAKRIVCTLGTLSHAAVFAKPGIELTALLRCGTTLMPQLVINSVKQLDWYLVDAFRNLLPTEQGVGAYLYAPTPYFREYVAQRGLPACAMLEEERQWVDAHAQEYLRLWLATYEDPANFRYVAKKTMFDVVNSLSISFQDAPLDRRTFMQGV